MSNENTAALYKEVVSLVLAMWDEEPYTIAEEAAARFDISYDFAFELVEQAIIEEVQMDKAMYDDGEEYLFDYDGDALEMAGFGTDEDYGSF